MLQWGDYPGFQLARHVPELNQRSKKKVPRDAKGYVVDAGLI